MGLVVGLVLLGIAAVVGAVAAYEALTNARDDANKNFGNACVGSPTTPCSAANLTPISQSQADAEFKKLAATADSIPFDYPYDCCYSRAHEMCRMMEEDGIDCGKVWNYQNPGPPPGPPLSVNTPNHPSGQVTWGYHVAPTVDVRGDDGVVRTMVMDPSMFDHPVTVDEWRAAQHAPDSVTQYTDSSPYYRGIDGAHADYDPDYSKTQVQLIIHESSRDQQDPAFVQQLQQRREQRVKDNSN
jgi:hypothetical protein